MSHDSCCTSVNGQDHQSTQAMFHIHPKLLIGILARQEVPGSHRGALAFELKYYGILKHGLTWVKTYTLHQFYRMRDDNDDNLQHKKFAAISMTVNIHSWSSYPKLGRWMT